MVLQVLESLDGDARPRLSSPALSSVSASGDSHRPPARRGFVWDRRGELGLVSRPPPARRRSLERRPYDVEPVPACQLLYTVEIVVA